MNPLSDSVLVEPPTGTTLTPAETVALVRRVTARLLPFLWFLYVIAYLDRVNVGFAKLKMQPDLKLSDAVYGFGGGIFFVGYFLFEVPSNLIMERVGARRWIARIMLTWGILAMAMIFTRDKYSFYALRFLLGIAEAGFYPGVILYLTYWFTAAERGRMVGWFMTATMIANIFGSPASGLLLDVHGWGLKGWQWLFVLEGLPAVLLAGVVLAYLPNGPEDARWLSPEERAALLARREVERQAGANRHTDLRTALRHPRLRMLTLIYFCMTAGQYGVTLWLPQIVKDFNIKSTFVVGLLTAIPYIAAAFGVVLIGAHSDKTQERRLHVAVPAFVGATGLALSAFLPSPALRLAALALAGVGMWGTLGGFWSLPVQFLAGTAAAGGIAFINAVGNLGGFFGPYAIGEIKNRVASPEKGTALSLMMLACSMTCAGLIALRLRSVPTVPDPVETALAARE